MRIVFLLIVLLLVDMSLIRAQSCTSCTVTLSSGGGNVTISSGQTYCLMSGGTYNVQNYGGLVIAAGGTLCIDQNATFTSAGGYSINGTIINRGTLNLNGGTNNFTFQHIINYGHIVVASWVSAISGDIENYGTIEFPTVNISNAFTLTNYGLFKAASFASNSDPNGTYINNQDSLLVTDAGGFEGTLDNSGLVSFNGLSGNNGLSQNQH